MANHPLHVPSRSSPAYAFREHIFRFLATGDQTGGSYSAMEIDSPHLTGAGPHTHDLAEEHFFLLEGEVQFTVADQSITVRPGDFVHIPRATVHSFTVLTDTARFLATYTPAGEELAFLELGTPMVKAGGVVYEVIPR